MRINFITNYPDYAEFRDYIQNNFTSDYASCTDFRDYRKLILPVTALATLILKTT